MFAKIFNQIYDSSIVENPETRFTFMDFLILADRNGVVDMTSEAIARRTNRPLELIQKTIIELEGPDPYSRTPDANGARIFRLDEHRDWGWGIVNYDYYRKLASQEQRREKTKIRTQKWRKKLIESSPKRHAASRSVTGDDSPSPSPSAYKNRCTVQEAEAFCEQLGLPRSDGKAMFLHWEEKGWAKVKDWKLTIRKWQSFGYLPSQKRKEKNPASDAKRGRSVRDDPIYKEVYGQDRS